jgi:hypothetical protein
MYEKQTTWFVTNSCILCISGIIVLLLYLSIGLFDGLVSLVMSENILVLGFKVADSFSKVELTVSFVGSLEAIVELIEVQFIYTNMF